MLGDNLVHRLLFQAGLWLVLAAIFADAFFLAGFPLRNLALFSFCFALATPLFWFNSVGVENLMLAGALILIVLFRFRGLWVRYLAALLLVALLPMFKLSGTLIGLGALTGYLIDRFIEICARALRKAAVTMVAVAVVAAVICLCVMPSFQAVIHYLRGGAEITGGYSAAMSMAGPKIELIAAAGAVAVTGALLWLTAASNREAARFYLLFLAVPLFVSPLNKPGALGLLILLFFVIWQDVVAWQDVVHASGLQAGRILIGAMRFGRLKQHLDSSIEELPEASRIEWELVDIIGDSPVASLSNSFTNLAASRMRLSLYPVVQRYSAYTLYLDRLNASWIRDQGPQFLVFDGKSIDGRDPWTETPAMWLEVYRLVRLAPAGTTQPAA